MKTGRGAITNGLTEGRAITGFTITKCLLQPGNLGDMNIFLERHKLPNLTQENTVNWLSQVERLNWEFWNRPQRSTQAPVAPRLRAPGCKEDSSWTSRFLLGWWNALELDCVMVHNFALRYVNYTSIIYEVWRKMKQNASNNSDNNAIPASSSLFGKAGHYLKVNPKSFPFFFNPKNRWLSVSSLPNLFYTENFQRSWKTWVKLGGNIYNKGNRHPLYWFIEQYAKCK